MHKAAPLRRILHLQVSTVGEKSGLAAHNARIEMLQIAIGMQHAGGRAVGIMSTDTAFEKHLTPAQIADLWEKDPKTIRRMFEDEPGVLIDERPETRKKRRYRSFSIPTSVIERVHRRIALGTSIKIP
jgi:hypothetical protein